ncbi:type II toxin-antitoxin system RelE/ParE family toxin [Amaricoccus tamworthensis]|uniref:type II toxin-antitoxin system RelE/ParE family toxin n=1 Tax=Amaricoccus tamworthensis TaxID=57002 RepID=UPI003C7A31C8
MRLIYSPLSRDNLRDIERWLVYRNASAAVRVIDHILTVAEMLTEHPFLGRVYQDDTRRLAVPRYPYCIYYAVDEAKGIVSIETILHTSRMPPVFRES